MKDAEALLTFADSLVRHKTGHHLSDLQQLLLLTALKGVKQSYEDIAEAYNYSPRYLRQNVAPKLWQLLSQALACKVSKTNARSVLAGQMQTSPPVVPPLSVCPASPSQPIGADKGDILLVDDHPENLTLLSHVLEEEGHQVRQAINGVVALDLMAFTLPDLLLLDVNMPELDGYSVCQKLKDNPATQDIPVIFVSALDEAWDKVKAFSVGGSDYITKPFKTIEVVARVQNQLHVRRLQQALKEQGNQLQAALHEIEGLKAQLQQTELIAVR